RPRLQPALRLVCGREQSDPILYFLEEQPTIRIDRGGRSSCLPGAIQLITRIPLQQRPCVLCRRTKVDELTIKQDQVGGELLQFAVPGIEGTFCRSSQQPDHQGCQSCNGTDCHLYDVSTLRTQIMNR